MAGLGHVAQDGETGQYVAKDTRTWIRHLLEPLGKMFNVAFRVSGCSERESLARVAELADAHGSGPCAREGVGVQVPPRAPTQRLAIKRDA